MLRERSLGSVKILSVDYDALTGELKKIAGDIKQARPHVKKVLLFGSFARGDYTPESNVDIMLIIERSDTHFIKRADEFIDFFIKIPFDVNMLVYTESEVGGMKDRISRIMETSIEL